MGIMRMWVLAILEVLTLSHVIAIQSDPIFDYTNFYYTISSKNIQDNANYDNQQSLGQSYGNNQLSYYQHTQDAPSQIKQSFESPSLNQQQYIKQPSGIQTYASQSGYGQNNGQLPYGSHTKDQQSYAKQGYEYYTPAVQTYQHQAVVPIHNSPQPYQHLSNTAKIGNKVPYEPESPAVIANDQQPYQQSSGAYSYDPQQNQYPPPSIAYSPQSYQHQSYGVNAETYQSPTPLSNSPQSYQHQSYEANTLYIETPIPPSFSPLPYQQQSQGANTLYTQTYQSPVSYSPQQYQASEADLYGTQQYQTPSVVYTPQPYQQETYGTTGLQSYQRQSSNIDTGSHQQNNNKGYRVIQIKKVYVPIVIQKKKKKKVKTITTAKGFAIKGGTQMSGKFKNEDDCRKECEKRAACFGADYNKWTKKCYQHSQRTICNRMTAHPQSTHFKKIPCELVETTRGLISPGAQLFGGFLQKGVKNLQDCIKKCANLGNGIAPNPGTIRSHPQECVGVDYDFATHKCYFHTRRRIRICRGRVIRPPPGIVPAETVVNIIICPPNP